MANNNIAVTLQLSRPIQTHQGTTRELHFREMTAGVMMKLKRLPFSIKTDDKGMREIETDFELAAKYIAELTGIEEELLEQLAPKDFAAACQVLGELVADAGN